MLLLALLSCDKPTVPPPAPEAEACDPAPILAAAPALTAGTPQAGVAEATYVVPVGTPLTGYTGRCTCFGGGDLRVDRRDSAYTYSFVPSVGVQTAIPIKVLWLTNGDQDFVLVKIDLIYSFDGLVEELEERLGVATGRDLDGKVVVATSHTHHGTGDFSDQVTYYLGSDRFNYEVFESMASQTEAVALAAYDGLAPAKIGFGFDKDWDPTDSVYNDRRGDNDSLGFFPDIPDGAYKDPWLSMLRVDDADDNPLAVIFDFGMHGTTLDADNAMISGDAPGGVERVFEERFDTPVMVAMIQGGGGDASPSGSDSGYARLESTGEAAADAIYALWERTPTSGDAVTLEVASRAVPQTHADIRVTRGGAVDLYYMPLTDDEDFLPDNVVYADDGSLLSPIDEFNAPYGAAFCGEDPAYLPGFAPADAFPYSQCVTVDKLTGVIDGFFDLTDEEQALPLLESRKATVSALRIGPVVIGEDDGSVSTDDVLMGFFPGEPTALYTEQFRRRAKAELGYDHAIAVGYAQDHEGYLLIPEDWLMGGYEADINVWGPLQGEHIMEGLLNMAGEVLSTTDKVEPTDPCGEFAALDYGENTWPGVIPDLSPEAGTLLDTPPDYLYAPLYTEAEFDAGVQPDLDIPAQVARVQGLVQMAWIGGDPAVDFPFVTLERLDGDEWEPVTTASGRTITLGPDILTATTPDPLYPPEAEQTHYWWASWQAVGHVVDRAGLPLGTYRLHVSGRTWDGQGTTGPWGSEEYEASSDPFELVPAQISVTSSGTSVSAWLAGPTRGYRLVGLGGAAQGANPLPDDRATLYLLRGDGTEESLEAVGTRSGGVTTFADVLTEGVVSVRVVDVYDNEGTLDL